jgi:hypothetical protein
MAQWTPPPVFATNYIVTAADWDTYIVSNQLAAHAGTFLGNGYAQVIANQATITTEVDLTGLTVTVTTIANRRYRISFQCLTNRTVADGETTVRIKEGATQLGQSNIKPATAATNNFHVGAVVITPTAGSHTYKLTMTSDSGTGSSTMTAGATFPAYILIEDVGQAS